MTNPTTETSGPVPVTIFGRTYQLRGDDQNGYLQELAEVVDTKMREVAAKTGTADTLSVAVLASLNLADEYLRASTSGSKSASAQADKRLARMIALLDDALTE